MANDMQTLLERKARLFQEHKKKISDIRQQVMKYDFNQLFVKPQKFSSPEEKDAMVQSKLEEAVLKIPAVYEMFPHLWDRHQSYTDVNRRIGGTKTEGVIPGAWNQIINDYGVINNEKGCIELLRKVEGYNKGWQTKFEMNEEMLDKKQRYTVTMDMYIYARNDEGAVKVAQEIAQKERDQWDNQAQVLSVTKTPFASADSKEIYKK